MTDWVIDIETDGIEATKIHCMVAGLDTLLSYDSMTYFLNSVTISQCWNACWV
jgi:hypothetical protein